LYFCQQSARKQVILLSVFMQALLSEQQTELL